MTPIMAITAQVGGSLPLRPMTGFLSGTNFMVAKVSGRTKQAEAAGSGLAEPNGTAQI
jgi:hypothetical protein